MNQGRTLPITALAATSTFGLFYLMQALVASDIIDIPDEPPMVAFDAVFTKPPEPPARPITRIDRPTPPLPTPPTTTTRPVPGDTFVIPSGPIPKAPTIAEVGKRVDLGAIDGQQIPIVRVQPQYPQRALERGVEGWTVVDFTVRADGTVDDPVIIDSAPKGYFEAATLKAIMKYKYKARVIDGRAVATQHVRYRMVFTLDNDK